MDMNQLTELVERLVTSQATSMEHADERQRDLMQQLLAARPDAAVARAEKLAKLGAALRKSTKVEDFKEGGMAIKEWLRRFNMEVTSLRIMQGIPDDLTREESIGLFKDMLDYTVVQRLDLVFAARDPVVTWVSTRIKSH